MKSVDIGQCFSLFLSSMIVYWNCFAIHKCVSAYNVSRVQCITHTYRQFFISISIWISMWWLLMNDIDNFSSVSRSFGRSVLTYLNFQCQKSKLIGRCELSSGFFVGFLPSSEIDCLNKRMNCANVFVSFFFLLSFGITISLQALNIGEFDDSSSFWVHEWHQNILVMLTLDFFFFVLFVLVKHNKRKEKNFITFDENKFSGGKTKMKQFFVWLFNLFGACVNLND